MDNAHRIYQFLNRKGLDYTFAPVNSHDCGITDMRIFLVYEYEEIKNLWELIDSSWGRDQGLEIGHPDEYTGCSHCGNVSRTNHYHQLPNYIVMDDETICRECVPDHLEEILEHALDNERFALYPWLARMMGDRIQELEHGFETGYHPGQTASPKKILAKCQEKFPGESFVFVIDEAGPFTTEWSVFTFNSMEVN